MCAYVTQAEALSVCAYTRIPRALGISRVAALDGVESDPGFALELGGGRREPVLAQELQRQSYHVCRVDFHLPQTHLQRNRHLFVGPDACKWSSNKSCVADSRVTERTQLFRLRKSAVFFGPLAHFAACRQNILNVSIFLLLAPLLRVPRQENPGGEQINKLLR